MELLAECKLLGYMEHKVQTEKEFVKKKEKKRGEEEEEESTISMQALQPSNLDF